ncbi:MAG: carbon-nitrogen hydrolase family protein [Gammaproteobacteria bacterium]|nr:carbon-nitrogen hydrolase family protein [Gammaproteobacteria bacterium]
MTKVAAIQMASGPNVSANLLEAEKQLTQAADLGARLVVLPENFAFMGAREIDKLDIAEQDGDGPIQTFLQQQAAKHGFFLVGGTVPIKTTSGDKVRSACILYSSEGKQLGRYDKMHMFDVEIPESGDQYFESEAIQAGDRPSCYETPYGHIAMAVCYDLRFPEHFRSLLDDGMDLIAVPSSFTAQTGKAHWEVLLRARAIENLSYVVAAAQGGFHVGGRETWGHSMIVDPWGNVLNSLAKGPGVVIAEISSEQQENTRKAFPVLQHRRLKCGLD